MKCLKIWLASQIVVEPPPDANDGHDWDPPMSIPRGREAAIRVYGNPGAGKVDRAWKRQNMILVKDLPGPKSHLYVHRLVEPFLREALYRAEGELSYIKRLGCFNFRHQRHDPRRPLSYHAFGVAVDINPAANKAQYRSRSNPVPRPFTKDWEKWYPRGVPEDIVNAFRSVGWTWGGDWEHFVDPMHFQLVR